MSSRTGSSVTARSSSSSFNAGGGFFSGTSFDGMNFNWDGFFAVFLIRSQEDLLEWKKAMRKLRTLSLQAELAGHDLAIALQQMRDQFKRTQAALGLIKSVADMGQGLEKFKDAKNAGEAGDVGGRDVTELYNNDRRLTKLLGDPENKKPLEKLGLGGRQFLTADELKELAKEKPELARELGNLYVDRSVNGGIAERIGLIEADRQRLRNQLAQLDPKNEKAAQLEKQIQGLDEDLGRAEAALFREMGDVRGDTEVLKNLVSLRADHAKRAKALGERAGNATDARLEADLATAEKELIDAQAACAAAKRDPKTDTRLNTAKKARDEASDKVTARQQERAALLTVRVLDRELSVARSQHEGYDGHVGEKLKDLEDQIKSTEDETMRTRLTRQRDALEAQLPPVMLQKRVDDAQRKIKEHADKYPSLYADSPDVTGDARGERDAKAKLAFELRVAKQAQERARFHVDLDTETYRTTRDGLTPSATALSSDDDVPPYDNDTVSAARAKAEQAEQAFLSEADPKGQVKTRADMIRARTELQVMLRENELSAARNERKNRSDAVDLQGPGADPEELRLGPGADPDELLLAQAALGRAQERCRAAEAQIPLVCRDAPSDSEIKKAQEEATPATFAEIEKARGDVATAKDELDAIGKKWEGLSEEEREVEANKAELSTAQDKLKKAEKTLNDLERAAQRPLNLQARKDPEAFRAELELKRVELETAKKEQKENVPALEADIARRDEALRQGEHDDLADMRTAASANDRLHNPKDLADPKWMHTVAVATKALDKGGEIIDKAFGDNSPWVEAVDKAVGSAIGYARKQRKATHGQMRQVVSKSQGMINQLIQVLGMSRSR